MTAAYLERRRNRLGGEGDDVTCAAGTRGNAGAFNLPLVFLVAAGLLLGFLLPGGVDASAQDSSVHGDLRFEDDDDDDTDDDEQLSGRLEVFYDPDGDGSGQWKGIPDKGQSSVALSAAAKIACRQMGFSGGTSTTGLRDADDEKGSHGDLVLAGLICEGSELRLIDCAYNRGAPHTSSYVGATCEASTENDPPTGSLVITGRAQRDKTLTADHSGITDPDTKPSEENSITYQWFEFENSRSSFSNDPFEGGGALISGETDSTYKLGEGSVGQHIKVKISFIDGAGNSEAVTSAPVGPVEQNLPDGTLRLGAMAIFSYEDNRGRVEIWDDPDGDGTGEWKGVCDDGWGTEEAEVVCTNLGIGNQFLPAVGLSAPVDKRLLFLLDDVVCAGNETSLLDCAHSGRGVNDCSSLNEYAGVVCNTR